MWMAPVGWIPEKTTLERMVRLRSMVRNARSSAQQREVIRSRGSRMLLRSQPAECSRRAGSGAEPRRRTGDRLRGFLFPALRRRVRLQRPQQAHRNGGYVVDRGQERGLV